MNQFEDHTLTELGNCVLKEIASHRKVSQLGGGGGEFLAKFRVGKCRPLLQNGAVGSTIVFENDTLCQGLTSASKVPLAFSRQQLPNFRLLETISPKVGVSLHQLLTFYFSLIYF